MNRLNEFIAKVIADEELRKQFFMDPARAAEGYNLSDVESAQLHAMDISELSEINTNLEERLSKSFIELPSIDNVNDSDHTSHSNGPNGHATHTSVSHSSW